MLNLFGRSVSAMRLSEGSLPKGEQKRARRRLFVESLESRQLMAVDSFQITGELADADKLLVQFSNPTPSALIGQSYAGSTITRQLTNDGWFQIDVGQGTSLTQALASFQTRSDVIQATPDFKIQSQAVPNDPSFSSLWGLSNNGGQGGVSTADISAEQAWNYGTSSSIVTAVIDSGVDYRHPDLAANIWVNTDEVAGNGIDDDGNGYIDDTRGWDFANNDNDPMDDNGHGTHVAGTIGAVGNNGIGIAGVAWSTKIMPLKFLSSNGSGALSDAIEAINYARANGAKVINASWGGGGFSSALQSAITQFITAGGIFVAAAGNESSNNAAVASYPANYTGVISVGASTRADTLASFSNYGSNVDIVAPGQSIYSTLPNNSYGTLSGTSMASPHVAGAIALLWGQNPTKTAAQITDAILSNTDNILRGSVSQYGRLNIGKAAAALKESAPPDDNSSNPPPVSNSPKTYQTQAIYTLSDATSRGAAVHNIPIDVSDSITIGDLDVALNISHTYVSDLGIRLIAPDGTSRTLIQRRGGSSDNIVLTLSDEATSSVSQLSTLRGTVRAESLLSGFDGKNAKGRWILQITDYARGDVGRLLEAKLIITPSVASQSASTTSPTNGSNSRELQSVIDWWRSVLSDLFGNTSSHTATTSMSALQNTSDPSSVPCNHSSNPEDSAASRSRNDRITAQLLRSWFR